MVCHSPLQAHRFLVILVILVGVANEGLSWLPTVNAFSSSCHRQESSHYRQSHLHQRRTSQSPSKLPLQRRKRIPNTALALGDDWWNSFKGLFDGLSNSLNNSNDGQNSDDYDDDLAAGTSVIASIPVQSLKPGGLRLFLMFYLMGMQNTPDQGSWKAHQPDSPPSPMTQYSSSTPTRLDDDSSTKEADSDDSSSKKEFDSPYVLEMFYKDASAMISIELLPHEVQILRCGSLPSTSFLMQETVLVEGILDELEQCAFDDSVDEDNRLLLLTSPDGIDNARSTLSFA